MPAIFDTKPFKVVSKANDKAVFAAEFSLTNYSGTVFNVGVEREVRLLKPAAAWKSLGVKPAKDVSVVAYASDNKIINQGKEAWKKGNRFALRLDSRHVQSVAVHDDRRADQGRSGVGNSV